LKTEQDIEEVLDRLILKTESKHTFLKLSEKQRKIAAVQVLITTITRNGVEIFFTPQYEHLWGYAQDGLKLIKADQCINLYSVVMKSVKNIEDAANALNELEDQIVTKNFEFIYVRIREYINENFEDLTI
jgi:hypothetical protein